MHYRVEIIDWETEEETTEKKIPVHHISYAYT